MAVYDETGGNQGIAFHTSPNLKNWTYQSQIDGFFECPDLFELPVDGNPGGQGGSCTPPTASMSWAISTAVRFTQPPARTSSRSGMATSTRRRHSATHPIAGESRSAGPMGSRFPGMPFNQQMTVPVQLTLRSAGDGLRLFAQPLSELASLRGPKHEWTEITPDTGDNPLRKLKGDLFEITVDFSPDRSESSRAGPARNASLVRCPPAGTRLQRRAGAPEPPGGPGSPPRVPGPGFNRGFW